MRCRDDIAKTWPDSIDDSNARRDWGWQHKYDLDEMVQDMFAYLKAAAEKKKAAAEAKRS